MSANIGRSGGMEYVDVNLAHPFIALGLGFLVLIGGIAVRDSKSISRKFLEAPLVFVAAVLRGCKHAFQFVLAWISQIAQRRAKSTPAKTQNVANSNQPLPPQIPSRPPKKSEFSAPFWRQKYQVSETTLSFLSKVT